MKAIVTILLLSCSTIILCQTQLDVQGITSSTDTVVKIKVNYSGASDVVGLTVHSFPALDKGIGAVFYAGRRGIIAKSTSGRAVSGESINASGVYGFSEQARGVYGKSMEGSGIRGESTNGPGVYGSSENGFAGEFVGKVRMTESIKIGNTDDPDPIPGTIRFTGLNFEGWNGFTWVLLTPFQVESIISDIDGNQYRTVKIGTQEWMAENLRTSKYRNGDAILHITNETDWKNLGSGAYCWYDNDSATYEHPYGRLYNWHAVDDYRGLCPTGWQVPSDTEWTMLTDFLGGESVAGGKMKETGTAHWNSPNTGASNDNGFTGLPGGSRWVSYTFDHLGIWGVWWSSTWQSGASAWYRRLSFNSNNVDRINDYKWLGFSVRCVKD